LKHGRRHIDNVNKYLPTQAFFQFYSFDLHFAGKILLQKLQVDMPYWYYDKKELRNTPSIQDGIDYETECRYRKEGARFIIDTGTKMDLGYNTMATGVVYFHRFYMFHSFRAFPRYVS